MENTCQNNGSCYVNSGSVLCICPIGYKGSYCELATDNCSNGPCRNAGICTNYLDGYSCNCTENFYGTNCQNSIKYNHKDLYFFKVFFFYFIEKRSSR